MSTETAARDQAINSLGTKLEALLTHAIAAYREGETRVTLENVGQMAQARHDALRANGYLYDRGRYEGTLRLIDEATPAYPGVTSQELARLAYQALELRGSEVFIQTDIDSKTNQSHAALSEAARIFDLEIAPLGRDATPRDTFGPARGTLQASNFFRTTRSCCR